MSARSRSPSELADVLLPALQAKPRRDTNHGRDGPEREPGVEMVQRDGSPGERLDEGALDGGQLIMTAEVDLNRSDEPIEQLRRACAAVELVPGEQPLPGRPMWAATRGFPAGNPRQTGGIPV
jgi:hypothetical protein